MAVEIKSVKRFSALYFKGVKAGDKLVAVNGNKIRDFLDYEYYIKEEKLVLDCQFCNKKYEFSKIFNYTLVNIIF